MLKIFENSDVTSFVYDLTVEASDVTSFQYLLTNLDIIYLEHTSTLPIQLTSVEMTESNLKNYITFFKDGYVVENSNIQVYITDAYTGGKKVEFIVAYEEGLYAYSGYYSSYVNVEDVPAISVSDYDLLTARGVIDEIGSLYLVFDKIVCTYKAKELTDRHIQNIITGNGNTYYCETNKSKNREYAVLVAEKV